MKIIRIRLSPEAEEIYNYLNKEASTSKTERMILNALNKKVELIKLNPHFGNAIQKTRFPWNTGKSMGLPIFFGLNFRVHGGCCIP